MNRAVIATAVLLAALTAALWSQSIATDGNIETDAQLVSKAATGTAPLDVSSTTMVPSLNADQVDGFEGEDLAAVLVALQDQVDALGLALVPRTGQSTCYDAAGTVIDCGTDIGPGQDGDLQLGVSWPNPRFTDNGDGTVTDNLTSLIWLDDASCFSQQTWADALAKANALHDGCTDCGPAGKLDCGLSDGSLAGEWRLPNIRELQSLVHYGVWNPAVPNTTGTGKWTESDPFTGVESSSYWSSTTYSTGTPTAWFASLGFGLVDFKGKTFTIYVWPVRGGQ